MFADFLANLAVSVVYHGIVATRKLLKPKRIYGAGAGPLEKRLREKLKKEGWKK